MIDFTTFHSPFVQRVGETVLPHDVALKMRQASCDHRSTFSFGCTPGVTRCDKCGKTFGVEQALEKAR